MVEAVRAGTIFAHDDKQYRRWGRGRRRRPGEGKPLIGQRLERHIAVLAHGRPDLVMRSAGA